MSDHHPSDRRERAMRVLGLLVGAVALCGVAQAQERDRPGRLMEGLTGSCWMAEQEDGVTDTHCFSVAHSGNLVMDVHKVRSPPHGVVYEGVTVYRFDHDEGQVGWHYYTSGGQLMTGYVVREGDLIRFLPNNKQPAEISWTLATDAYETRSTAERSEPSRFVKVGPAPEGGF